MDNSVEDVSVPAAPPDAELPDMVPVSIRTSLTEFQHCSLEKVLAGVLLTWEEFLGLFDIRASPNEYFIKGYKGQRHELSQKIGDYVSSFKKKLKIYPVTLERVHAPHEAIPENSESSNLISSNGVQQSSISSNPIDEKDVKGKGVCTPPAKKQKLIDADRRKKNNRKTKELIVGIAQSVVQSMQSQPNIGTATAPTITAKRPSASGKKAIVKRNKVKSRSPTPSKDLSSKPPMSAVAAKGSASSKTSKLKRLGSTEQRITKDKMDTGIIVKKGRKPRQKLVEDVRRSSRNSRSTKESEPSGESSVSEDEEVPSRDKKNLLKQCVLKYLQKHVSPRSFMRLRNELVALRDGEKYFKVTSVVPMTAGMMEQSFCRKINP